MKDNRLLKVLWGIVLAIFLCSALFIGISYFTGGDSSSSKKKDNEITSSSKDKDNDKGKDKDSSKSKTKEKSDEEKYREAKDSNNGNNSSTTNSSKSESNKSNNSNKAVNNTQNNTNKEDKKEVTEANGGAVAPGTFNNSEAAHNYAKEEINRLAKENKKHYSYALERNNKGEVVVKITEG